MPETLDLRYPIGQYLIPPSITRKEVNQWINEIKSLPERLQQATSQLNDNQLNTTYRPDGWTLRQVVHHLADSHINSYVRFRWTMTEDRPMIKAYQEQDWAELPDAKQAPIDLSLSLLSSLHVRWVYLLESLSDTDLKRTFLHPANQKEWHLDALIGMYAWHGNHHLAHITTTVERNNWGI